MNDRNIPADGQALADAAVHIFRHIGREFVSNFMDAIRREGGDALAEGDATLTISARVVTTGGGPSFLFVLGVRPVDPSLGEDDIEAMAQGVTAKAVDQVEGAKPFDTAGLDDDAKRDVIARAAKMFADSVIGLSEATGLSPADSIEAMRVAMVALVVDASHDGKVNDNLDAVLESVRESVEHLKANADQVNSLRRSMGLFKQAVETSPDATLGDLMEKLRAMKPIGRA